MTSNGWWFYWPLLAWGIGLTVHATVVGFASSGWEDRKIHELMDHEFEERLHPRPAT